MKRDVQPERNPLLWAALCFVAGLWVGVHAWRPATWWIAAALVFAISVLWFTQRRPWMAKALSFGMWIVIGALLIQVRPLTGTDPKILELADGREVAIVGHVVREGYAPKTIDHIHDVLSAIRRTAICVPADDQSLRQRQHERFAALREWLTRRAQPRAFLPARDGWEMSFTKAARRAGAAN